MIFHSYVSVYQRVAIPSLGGMSRGPSRAWTQTCAAMGNHREHGASENQWETYWCVLRRVAGCVAGGG